MRTEDKKKSQTEKTNKKTKPRGNETFPECHVPYVLPLVLFCDQRKRRKQSLQVTEKEISERKQSC